MHNSLFFDIHLLHFQLLLTCAGFFVSIFGGLALCLTLEFPFTALLKELISAKEPNDEAAPQKENGTENGVHNKIDPGEKEYHLNSLAYTHKL